MKRLLFCALALLIPAKASASAFYAAYEPRHGRSPILMVILGDANLCNDLQSQSDAWGREEFAFMWSATSGYAGSVSVAKDSYDFSGTYNLAETMENEMAAAGVYARVDAILRHGPYMEGQSLEGNLVIGPADVKAQEPFFISLEQVDQSSVDANAGGLERHYTAEYCPALAGFLQASPIYNGDSLD